MHLVKGGELIMNLHVLLENGFQSFRRFRNASVKFLKLSKPISLNIGEREEEKEGNQVLYASVMLP